ncbi:hypothetical protein [Kitasatospora sp. P5_F3]
MLDSTPSKDNEPASFVESTKALYAKHKPKVAVAAGVVGGLALTALARALMQPAGEVDADDPRGQVRAQAAPPVGQVVIDPDRDPFLRRLRAGHRASPEARQRYRELTGGKELPDGYTVVRRFLRPDDPDV